MLNAIVNIIAIYALFMFYPNGGEKKKHLGEEDSDVVVVDNVTYYKEDLHLLEEQHLYWQGSMFEAPDWTIEAVTGIRNLTGNAVPEAHSTPKTEATTAPKDDVSPSEADAKETLRKFNPNLVEFIDNALKSRDQLQNFDHLHSLDKDCLYLPDGACQLRSRHTTPVPENPLLLVGRPEVMPRCKLHPDYYEFVDQSMEAVASLLRQKGQPGEDETMMQMHAEMSSKRKTRYRCELGSQYFPANQTGTKVVTPEVLLEVLNISRGCVLATFYSPYCEFSAEVAPTINGIGRLYPGIYVLAIDVLLNKNLDARLGVVGTPISIFFYNGQPVSRYHPRTLDVWADLLTNLTGMEPEGRVESVDADVFGPMPTRVVAYVDWLAVLSSLICAAFFSAVLVSFTKPGNLLWTGSVRPLLLHWGLPAAAAPQLQADR